VASRSGGRNTAFRPQDRTITLVDDLDRMGCIGQDLHIATVDMEVNTQIRAYPFYKAPEWVPHKKLLLNSIDF